MAIEVTLPQLGESVTEGTIINWLVEVGDRVETDQPLFELSSEKIDTEVPSPAAGVLTEIKVGVDETVDVGTVVAIIGEEGEQADTAEPDQADTAEPDQADTAEPQQATAEPAQEEAEPAPAATSQAPAARRAPEPTGDGEAETPLMSPLVRRMVAEHGLDPGDIRGTGSGGRITREDVETAIAGAGEGAPPEPAPTRAQQPQKRQPAPAPARPLKAGDRERLEDLSRIRQRIASRMMESMQQSAQLTTVQEADVTEIMRLRGKVKESFRAREGVSLSPFVFMARAAVLALRRYPTVNARPDFEAGKVRYHDYVNLGIAVDTDKGLIVPNVKGADDLTLAALARAVQEAADKARGVKKLEMQDIEGGTFTVTNTGSRGVLLDTPILNYPEVAILATGVIQKRPIVVEDTAGPAIAVRDMIYLCLTYDHRILDGADAARFVTDVKEVLETHDWAGEVGYDHDQ